MSLAAAEKTLTILRDTTALADIASYGKAMQEGMRRILWPAACPIASPAMTAWAACSSARRRRQLPGLEDTATTASTTRSRGS